MARRATPIRSAVATAAAALVVCLLGAPVVAQDGGSPAPATPKPATCPAADALRASGQLPEAAKKYGQVLDATPGIQCAQLGLDAIAEDWLKRARALVAVGDAAGALKAVQQALALDPQLADGLDGDLRHLNDPDRPDTWADFVRDVEPYARKAGEVVLGLLALAVFALAITRLAAGARRVFRKRLRIEDFTGHDAGAPLAILLREELGRLKRGGQGGSVDLAGPYGEAVSVPADLGAALPQLKLIGPLLELASKLLWTRERVLNGHIHADQGDRGRGVTLVLAGRFGAIQDQVTIWEAEIPLLVSAREPATYAHLALPCAIWALWAFDTKAFGYLGTTDWRSYLYFAEGAYAQQAAGGTT